MRESMVKEDGGKGRVGGGRHCGVAGRRHGGAAVEHVRVCGYV